MIINDKNGLLKVNSMMDELLEELDQNAAGPELEKAAELKNEATLEKAPSELTPAYTNRDMYGEDEDFAEDVGEVVYESDQLAAGPELERAAELKNEATLEKAPRELTADVDNSDIYGDDEDFAEDVGEVVVEEVLSFLLESDDDEFEELLPMLTEAQTDFCIELLDSEPVVTLCEQLTLLESTGAEKKEKIRNGVALGTGAATGAITTGLRHLGKAGWAAGALKTAGTIAGTAGVGLGTMAAGAAAAYGIKKGVQAIRNERAARKHAANMGTRDLKDKDGNVIAKDYNYGARRQQRREALLLNKQKHQGRKDDAYNYKLMKKDYKNGTATEEELNAAKKKAAESQRAYKVENAKIKRDSRLNAKIARAQARTDLKKNQLKGEQAYDTQKRMQYVTNKDVQVDPSDPSKGTRKQTAEEAKKENSTRTVTVTESYTDLELMQLLENNGYNATLNNLLILKEGLEMGTYEIFYEEELETEVMPAEAEDAGVAEDKPAERGEETEEKKEDENKKEEESSEEKDDDKKEEEVNEALSGIFALINQINESLSQEAAGPELDGAAELKNDATVETAEKELTSDKDNKDLFPADEHEQKEDVGEVVVKESDQLVAGPELDSAKELDNEATEEKAPKTAPASTDNKDIYCDNCHKQVEDVVEVVVEAVSACKAKGKPATRKNIAEEAKELFEMANFDIDAFIMSREMNGSKKFDEYEKLEGKGAECALTGLRESVKYNSLKEACMMDEGYFAEDSYVKETADEKVAKLTEQVSLLMAREANDPLYDELLKESAYCMRLREQLQNKYRRSAISKVEAITEAVHPDTNGVPLTTDLLKKKYKEGNGVMRGSSNRPGSATRQLQSDEAFEKKLARLAAEREAREAEKNK